MDSEDPASLTKELNYRETWHVALGTQYRPGEAWLLSAGVAYDSSAVADEDRTFSLPMGQAWRFSVGAQWQLSQRVSLNAAYTFLGAGDMEVVQSSNNRGTVAVPSRTAGSPS